jgi:ankyrin repeat protein
MPLPATNCRPGCGKSVLSKALVDENLLGQQENDTIVCYFFFKDTSPEQRSPVSALSALLHQLFASKKGASLIKHALPHFRKNKDPFTTNLEALWTIVRSIMEDPEHPRIIFLLDALDECKSDCQSPLIMQLKRCEKTQAPGENDANTFQFVLTSRPYWDIESEFQELIENMPNIRLPAEDESEALRLEINCVVEARLDELERSNVITSAKARDMLRGGLSKVENRTYLWIHIIFARLKKEPRLDVKMIRTFLNELPKSVEDAYEAILKRSKKPEEAKRLLHIIVAAKRPLFLKEIAVALYITDEVHSHEDLEIQEDSQLKIALRHLCGLFVSIIDGKVFLIHQSAKEFLLSRACSVVRPECWRQSFESRVSNLILARCCLLYLLFDEFKIARVFDSDEFGQYSFLDYSSQNWFRHIREAMEIDDSTKRMCLDVCNVQSNYFSMWSLIYRPDRDLQIPWDRNIFEIHCTHILFVLAYFGLDLAMAEVLKHTADVDIRNGNDVTPLFLAIEQGHEPVVRLLLHKQANANSKARHGYTPLMRAATFGHEAIVKLLLDKGADINMRNQDGFTALILAVEYNREGVVELLLDKDADIDIQNIDGTTALATSIRCNRDRLVKRLLDKQSNVNLQNGTCGSALQTRKPCIDSRDVSGRTPLSYAARYGHGTAARLLLQTGVVEVNSKDNDGRTPLSRAAENESIEVVELLLQTGLAEVNSKDNNGRTPLSWAAASGAPEVVELLLPTGLAEVNSKDNDGRTPLSWAAASGAPEVVELLLQTGLAEVNSKDNDGCTPLLWAAENKSTEVVKLLLQTGLAEVNSKDNNGQTPLSWAAGYENAAAVVELLLKTGGVEVDSKDNCNRTPLCWAAKTGSSLIIELLLETGKADVKWRDDSGRTPLLWAIEHNRFEQVEALLNTGKARTGSRDIETILPRELATPYGKSESGIAGLHTSKGHAKLAASPLEEALLLAVKLGNFRIVQRLLIVQGIEVDMADEVGRTPLSWAAEYGFIDMVKALLRSNASIELEDIHGRTPLSWAAWSGRWEIVEILLTLAS